MGEHGAMTHGEIHIVAMAVFSSFAKNSAHSVVWSQDSDKTVGFICQRTCSGMAQIIAALPPKCIGSK